MKKFLVGLIAALVVLVGIPAQANSNPHLSGYFAQKSGGGYFDWAQGWFDSWTTLYGNTDSSVSRWVGIENTTYGTLIQAGIRLNEANGNKEVFYELLGGGCSTYGIVFPVPFSTYPTYQGDAVYAAAKSLDDNNYEVAVINNTRGWNYTHDVYCTHSWQYRGTQADFIGAEREAVTINGFCDYTKLEYHSTTSFTASKVHVYGEGSGTVHYLASENPYGFHMYGADGTLLDSVSQLGTNSSFYDTWYSRGNIDPGSGCGL